MKSVLSNYQEVIVWLPVAVVILGLATWLFPQIDPRAGIDGVGDLYLFIVQVIKVMTAMFLAWVAQRAYFTDLPASIDRSLSISDRWEDQRVVIRHRVEYLILLIVLGWLLL